jgi:hypothetical protein
VEGGGEYTYSGCVFVGLEIQHAMHIRRIVIVACPTIPYLSILSHKQHDFQSIKKVLKTKRVLRFSLQRLSETFLSINKIEQDLFKHVY